MRKRIFRPGIASLSPHFGGQKSHEEVVADLKRELARPKIRRMAGELAEKKSFDYDSLQALKAAGRRKKFHAMKAIRQRKELHAIPARKHPADAAIIEAYRGAGRKFRTRNELFWFLEGKIKSAQRQTIEVRVRELIEAGIITDFSKGGKP